MKQRQPSNKIVAMIVVGMSLLLFAGNLRGQIAPDAKKLLDAAITHAKERSLYRTRVDWQKETAEIQEKAKNAKSVEELGPALKYLLAKLEDSHGKFLYKDQVIAYYFGEPTENQKKIDMKVWPLVQSRSFPFKAEMIDGSVGYVRIPGLPMGDNLKMATEIREGVCSLSRKGAARWIVDLRYNGGGNMYPMMQGLAPLIGDGVIGHVSDHDGRRPSTWAIKETDFFYDDYRAVDLGADCLRKKAPKVAVLISQYTTSSGEAVAVAFKGRPQTRFFGLDTAGLITVTDWTDLGGLTASISTGYYTDRNGVVYRNFVPPDERMEINIDKPITEDETITAAVKWLKK